MRATGPRCGREMASRHRVVPQPQSRFTLQAMWFRQPVHGYGKAARVSMSMSLAEARRLALIAQLSPGAGRPTTAPRASAILKVVDRLALLQIDSVNVLARAHYLPVFSRLGPYDITLLDALTYSSGKRRLFEYWAHE